MPASRRRELNRLSEWRSRSRTSPKGVTRRRSRRSPARSAAPRCSTATPTRSTTAPCSRSPRPTMRLVAALAAGARACVERIDMNAHNGRPPVRRRARRLPAGLAHRRASASRRSELALETAAEIATLGVPVFLYGELATAPERRERAFFRRGGLERARAGGCARASSCARHRARRSPTRRAGATLVTARPPLAAFNVELDTADVEVARAVAAELRESGGGLAGVRAVGVDLDGVAQVSTNVHDPAAVPLADRDRARPRAGRRARCAAGRAARSSGSCPRRRSRDLPADVPLRGFDAGPARARAAPRRPRIGSRSDTLSAHGADEEATSPQASGNADRRASTPGARADARAPARRPSRAARQKQSSKREAVDPRDLPPTWSGAFKRGLIGAGVFFLLVLAAFQRPVGARRWSLSVAMLAMYVPLGYYIDRFMYRRRHAPAAGRPRGQAPAGLSGATVGGDGRPLLHRRPGGRELLRRCAATAPTAA